MFGLGGHRDRLPACLAHMLYCVVAEEQYNLAYFFVKRIQCARDTPTANLSYGMFLTRLYRHVMETRVIPSPLRPLIIKARHLINMDDDDTMSKTSRASTRSPTTYLNSLNPLNYQNYHMPSASKQDMSEKISMPNKYILIKNKNFHEASNADDVFYVPAGSVVTTGKDSSIVSTGSTKVIPAGSTILVLSNALYVAESDPQQHITYEDFDQIGKLDLEELDIKWQMAMLSVRINRFEKKAGRKMKFKNKDAARFDKKKVKCYKCSELGHFARE
ncbi:ribosomal protein L7Ae/L30e/S12e/Gadd45, partial [Tanacetum coccineum]